MVIRKSTFSLHIGGSGDTWGRVPPPLVQFLHYRSHAVADPGFPRGGGANSPGEPTYDFAIFSQKLHEIERIWARGGRRGASPAPPLDPPLTWEGNVFTGVYLSRMGLWILDHCSALLQRGRYVSYWNAFLFSCSCFGKHLTK